MKELQLTFYDVISVLFPGVVLAMTCGYLFHTQGLLGWVPTNGMDIGQATIAFIVSYLIGHAINIVSKFFEDTPVLKQIFIYDFAKHDPNEQEIFYKKGVKVCLNKDVGCKIKTALSDKFPNIDFEKIEDVSEYLIQFVDPTDTSALAKRDVFVATASMMRNTAFVAGGFTLYFLVVMLMRQSDLYTGQYFLASLIGFVIFRYGFQKYKVLSERILFSTFLRTCIKK